MRRALAGLLCGMMLTGCATVNTIGPVTTLPTADENFERARQAGKALTTAQWLKGFALVAAVVGYAQAKDNRDTTLPFGAAGVLSLIAFGFDCSAASQLASIATVQSEHEKEKQLADEAERVRLEELNK